MANVVSAPPGTNILVLDRSDKSIIRIPVVAFDVLNTLAYPVTVIPFRGLVKAQKALELNGFIMDRGFEIPFDSAEAWVQWAMSVKPGSDEAPVAEEEQAQEAEEVAAAPKPAAAAKPKPEKARKTFAQKSFWSRTNMLGQLEVVEIDAGLGLPRDSEGFEKIKRDEYAAFKKQAKGGDTDVLVIEWNDGPVIPGESDEVIEETIGGEETEDAEDFGGLV